MQSKQPGDYVMLDTPRGPRTWRIIGCYIGAVGQESAIGLEVLDRTNPHVGEHEITEMIVPEALIEGRVFRPAPHVR